MGEVISKCSRILRKTKVSPDQFMTTEQNGIDQDTLQATDDYYFVNDNSDILQAKKYFPQVVHIDKYNASFRETSGYACSENFTAKYEQEDKIECMDSMNPNDEDDCVRNFCSSINPRPRFSILYRNESVRTESVIQTCVKDENIVSNLQSDIASNTNERGESSDGRCSLLDSRNLLTGEDTDFMKQLYHEDSLSDTNDKSLEKNETFMMEMISDGYSTEGTAGSEEISDCGGDLKHSGQDTVTRRLSENLDAVTASSGDALNDAIVNARASMLTPQSLEALNCHELDKAECVRSFIQAWEPLEINGPSCSSHSYDFSQPNETVERKDGLKSTSSSHERVVNESPTWNDLRNDRAPWNTTRSVETIGRSIFSTSAYDEDDENSWPIGGETWNESSNHLTLCSLSTINEESDEKERKEIDS